MIRPIRTLFISHDSGLYGAQLSLLGLLASLDRNVVESYVVAPFIGDFTQATEKLGLPLFVRPLSYWVVSTGGARKNLFRNYRELFFGLRRRVASLRALIEQYSIDVVYTNTVTCVDGALAAQAAGRRHIWHVREYISNNRDVSALLPAWMLARLIARLSAHVIVNSSALKSAYAAVPSKQISVVYNGIDLTAVYPDPTGCAGLVRELKLPEDAKLVTIIGSITPRKGHLMFVRAAVRVRQQYDKVAFLVVGDGEEPYLETVKASVRESGLNTCLRFTGWRSDVADILRASDVLVVAADQEAFGRTVIEGMAAGVPVVSTRCGGPEEIVVHGETGFLVPNGDSTAMADAIVSVITNPELALRLGDAGRARVEKMFSMQAYVGAIQSVLEQVASTATKSPATMANRIH